MQISCHIADSLLLRLWPLNKSWIPQEVQSLNLLENFHALLCDITLKSSNACYKWSPIFNIKNIRRKIENLFIQD